MEELIKSKLHSDAQILKEISFYLLELGGKRIRPAICLISAKALRGNNNNSKLIQIAAGIELIHMATLLHDDIIDKSKIRRHKSSPLKKYGANSTLLAGDFLLVRAFSLCSKLDPYIIEKTEQACVDLTEGEVLELPLYQEKHSTESSLHIAKKKTASLFRLACESAAFLCCDDKKIIEYMSHFGENIGMAFQVLDDILDVTSNEEILGKEPGADIRERKPSLVNVLWLESGDKLAEKLLSEPDDDIFYVERALMQLRNSEVIRAAKNIANRYLNTALDFLNYIENNHRNIDTQALGALKGLAEYCSQRME